MVDGGEVLQTGTQILDRFGRYGVFVILIASMWISLNSVKGETAQLRIDVERRYTELSEADERLLSGLDEVNSTLMDLNRAIGRLEGAQSQPD